MSVSRRDSRSANAAVIQPSTSLSREHIVRKLSSSNREKAKAKELARLSVCLVIFTGGEPPTAVAESWILILEALSGYRDNGTW